jgi:hypothetical protein
MLRLRVFGLLSEKENNTLEIHRGIFTCLKDFIYKVSSLLGMPIRKTNTAEIICDLAENNKLAFGS